MYVDDDVLDPKTEKAFNLLLQPVRKRMASGIFQKKFLPFLSLEPIPQETVQAMLDAMSRRTGQPSEVSDLTGNLLNEWMGEVGSPYVEVEVFQGDEILYIVPPLLDNSEDLVDDPDNTIPRLVEQAENQATVHPKLGSQFITQHVLPLLRKPNLTDKHRKMWNIIFRYHDLPLYPLADEPDSLKVNTVETKPSTTEDGLKIVDSLDEFDD